MTRADSFTSNNARVPAAFEPKAQARLHTEGQSAKSRTESLFGPCGRIDFKQYAGSPGDWRCGFVSWYGFHSRGRGPSALAAVADVARLPDDPTPSNQSWIPGSYTAHFAPYVAPARAVCT